MKKILIGASLALAALCSQAQAEDLQTFRIEGKNGVFTPNRLEVPAGKRIKIELHNTGKAAMEFESLPLRKEKVLGPGATSFVVLNPLSPGEYKFFDDFHPSTSKGVIVAK